jgi:hypothetical protein
MVGWLIGAAIKPGGEVARSTRGRGGKIVRAVKEVARIAGRSASCNSKSEADDAAGVMFWIAREARPVQVESFHCATVV